jgi:tRNA-specific adenosine deaminase 1
MRPANDIAISSVVVMDKQGTSEEQTTLVRLTRDVIGTNLGTSQLELKFYHKLTLGRSSLFRSSMVDQAELIAQCVLDRFNALPVKCKPRVHADGRKEWTPLSGVVVVRPSETGLVIECVSVATGTKCLPSSIISQCNGQVLHDSHAEVLALRGFNRWLLQELQSMLEHPSYVSPYIYRNGDVDQEPGKRPFRLADDLSIHFFTSEAPCGDASMDLLMQSKAPEDAIPWDTSHALQVDVEAPSLPGRADFGLLGVIRRKPARADAQSSLSKSCSDKLAIKQVTSILSFPADMFFEVSPTAFVKTLVVPHDQFHEAGYRRAFSPAGRAKFGDISRTTYFDVHPLPPHFKSFEFRKNSEPQKTSNISTVWIRASGNASESHIEILLNGVKQGYKQLSDDGRKQSLVCRQQMVEVGYAMQEQLSPALPATLATSYGSAKDSELRRDVISRKHAARSVLGTWIRNIGDEAWSI